MNKCYRLSIFCNANIFIDISMKIVFNMLF